MNGLTKFLIVAGIAAGVWWMRSAPAGPAAGSLQGEIVTELPSGEEIDLGTTLRSDEWTLLEFGAPW